MAGFQDIIGQQQIKEHLHNALSTGKVSHAYIFNGEKASGKEFIARLFARTLQCEAGGTEPCGECRSCKQAVNNNQPDIIRVTHEKPGTISVDDIRTQVNNDIAIKPYSSKYKVYIINEAEKMTVQAQNALLLTLEEPPAFVLFLLLAEDAGALLETIRSRAPVLRMQPVSDREIESYLLSPARDPKIHRAASALKESAPDDLAAILRMANGRIGAAVALLDEAKRAPLMENRAAVTEICHLLAERTRPDALLSALLAFGTNREEVTAKLLLLEVALRDLLLLVYSETVNLLFFTDGETAFELCNRFTARQLLGATEAIRETINALGANGNVRLLLVRLSSRLLTQ